MLRKFNYRVWSFGRKKYACSHLHHHIATSGYESYDRYELNSDILLSFTTFLGSKMQSKNNDFYSIIPMENISIILMMIPRNPLWRGLRPLCNVTSG